jgi:hypothetical protein
MPFVALSATAFPIDMYLDTLPRADIRDLIERCFRGPACSTLHSSRCHASGSPATTIATCSSRERSPPSRSARP